MKWPFYKLSQVCIRTGTRDPKAKPDTYFQYIDISGIDRDSKTIASVSRYIGSEAPSRARNEVQTDDILISTVRPNLNAVAMVPDKLDGEVASTGFCVLRSNLSLILPKFIFYYTQNPLFVEALMIHVRGANYPAITNSNVFNSQIPLPALSEQRKIVEILD